MILLTPRENAPASSSPPTVVLFGAGLVGSAIAATLQASAPLEGTVLALDWHQPERFSEQLAVIEDRLTELFSANSDSVPSRALRAVWSAGKAGFFSTSGEVARELASFEVDLHMIERLASRFPHVASTMVLMSSAGGLFEGQQHVGRASVPAPRRPYSQLKLRQEELLWASAAPIAKKIYRLTSVYGYIRHDQRKGLIPTLIANGLRQRASDITGRVTTLRDYVWIEDIAEYISRTLLDDDEAGRDSVAVLASAKSSSILEVQRIVEQALHRPLYVRFSSSATNSDDITFATESLPKRWHPSELDTNVRKIVADALRRQAVFEEAR